MTIISTIWNACDLFQFNFDVHCVPGHGNDDNDEAASDAAKGKPPSWD